MLSNWDGIDEFVAVYERGSFNAAAVALGVSASHVSRAIARLEYRLQSRLFYRTTRHVTATDIGKAFAERCHRMIEDREDAIAIVGERTRPHGILRVTCSIAFGESYVAQLLSQFVADHPGVEAVLDLSNSLVDIVAEGYDVAIRTGMLSDSRLIGSRISSRNLHLCASPAYLQANGRPKTIGDLAGHQCLVGSNEFWHFCADGAPLDFRPAGRWRCNSGFAVTDAAVAGHGICQLPDFYVLRRIEAGLLEPLLIDHAPPEEPVWAVYPNRQHTQSKVRMFVEILRRHLEEPNAIVSSRDF
ncbi:LysR substrate-binding domain-containing protein [Glacieibacterium sp.]|uniref:LysR substrate-binding domain-containing protein n=1 Tax=Glacieibacterium sp. TaxID=2860237 RepID=UPI003AFF6B6C